MFSEEEAGGKLPLEMEAVTRVSAGGAGGDGEEVTLPPEWSAGGYKSLVFNLGLRDNTTKALGEFLPMRDLCFARPTTSSSCCFPGLSHPTQCATPKRELGSLWQPLQQFPS